ncbi:MAG: nuclear transport factor 2 family protein [Candidatus Thiodiazotropha sp. (ex Dulcina madagascariensis)]|nr:nuclear transport factor 2 family protein [Candidatus Thiodiazotropha sp. (ex Dulcina madagascariensis)]MCU7928281.1 nuclear transport factor 2 family protein [Candidatus Thiodiazotropha sp. (ex Dulcina madagascariensis)]
MQPIDVVKQYFEAFIRKDIPGMSRLIHDDYHFTGPAMEVQGKTQMEQVMEAFPFIAEDKDVELSGNGNVVVRRLNWHVKAPFEAVIPMCEWLVVENGKIRSSNLYYDTAKFPEEFLKQMKAGQAA